MTWTQAPGVYSAKEATTTLAVGPHNHFVRNGIMLNDRLQLECFWVDDMTGFDYPDVIAAAQPNTEETGELPDPGFHGGRPMTMTGWIQAGSYPTMLDMTRALIDSFLDVVEMPMEIIVPVGAYLQQPPVYIECRPADRVQVQTQIQPGDIRGTIKRNFTISLRASDPTYKGNVEYADELVPLTVSIPGRPYDRFYDLAYNELMDLSGSLVADGDVNAVVIQNDGNWRAPVRMKATGPMSQITILNETSGQAMYLANIDAGESIEIDTHPARSSVKDQDGLVRMNLVDQRSDWIWLQGRRGASDGSNRIILFVEDYDVGAKLELWWRDTWL